MQIYISAKIFSTLTLCDYGVNTYKYLVKIAYKKDVYFFAEEMK